MSETFASNTSLYRESSAPTAETCDSAETRGGYVWNKCNTNTRAHEYTHYIIYTPPHTHQHSTLAT